MVVNDLPMMRLKCIVDTYMYRCRSVDVSIIC